MKGSPKPPASEAQQVCCPTGNRLIAETDGRDVHTTRKAFEHDRLRDQRLTLSGFTFVRFTWRQVEQEPVRIARALRGLLARLARP